MQDLEWAAERFAILGRYLRAAGEGGLTRELNRRITGATLPVNREVRAGLPAHMPARYAGVLAGNLSLPVSKLLGPNPGVRIRATSPGHQRKLKRLDNLGILGHPLFGNRHYWYDQGDGVTAGFFTGPMEASAPQMRDAIISAINDTEQQIVKGG